MRRACRISPLRQKPHYVSLPAGAVIEQVTHVATSPKTGRTEKRRGDPQCYKIRIGEYRIGLVIDPARLEDRDAEIGARSTRSPP